MSAPAHGGRATGRAGRMLRPGQAAFEALFDTAYRALGTGIAAAVAGGLPLALVVPALARPLEAWPMLLVLALPVGPAIAAAFTVFGAAQGADAVRPFRDLARAWPRTAAKALAVWAGLLAVVAVLVVDVGVVWGTPFAGLVGPVLAVVALLAALGCLNAFAVLAADPARSIRSALAAGAVGVVRRPVLSLVSLAVLAAWIVVSLAMPVLGLVGLGGFALLVLQADAAASTTVREPRRAGSW